MENGEELNDTCTY